jgi:hypothetical protein
MKEFYAMPDATDTPANVFRVLNVETCSLLD